MVRLTILTWKNINFVLGKRASTNGLSWAQAIFQLWESANHVKLLWIGPEKLCINHENAGEAKNIIYVYIYISKEMGYCYQDWCRRTFKISEGWEITKQIKDDLLSRRKSLLIIRNYQVGFVSVSGTARYNYSCCDLVLGNFPRSKQLLQCYASEDPKHNGKHQNIYWMSGFVIIFNHVDQ